MIPCTKQSPGGGNRTGDAGDLLATGHYERSKYILPPITDLVKPVFSSGLANDCHPPDEAERHAAIVQVLLLAAERGRELRHARERQEQATDRWVRRPVDREGVLET